MCGAHQSHTKKAILYISFRLFYLFGSLLHSTPCPLSTPPAFHSSDASPYIYIHIALALRNCIVLSLEPRIYLPHNYS